MKNRLALLCYRVARWLAPRLFLPSPYLTLIQARKAYSETAEYYKTLSAKERKTFGGQVYENIYLLKILVDTFQRAGYKSRTYEQLKVEIKHNGAGTAFDSKEAMSTGRHISEVVRDRVKREVFMAVAKGLAESAEIDKFMYFKEVGDLKTVGIRLYLRHDDK